jgi:hypothetical protein
MTTRTLRHTLARIALFAPLATGAGCTSEESATPDSVADAGAPAADGASAGDAGTATSATLNDGYKKATWGAGVTITYGDCTLTFASNGLPNHARDAEYALPNMGVMVPSAATAYAAADPTAAQTYAVTINTCKAVADTGSATPLGNIGYMISGASLFNPYEGDGTTIALASNFSVKNAANKDVYFVDSCNGHPTPRGAYHYHGLPSCVTSQVDTAGGPSHIIGIATDGYPIYGDRDANGKQLTAADVDGCGGVTSATPEFPGGVYHYVLLNTTDGSSSMRCLKGK